MEHGRAVLGVELRADVPPQAAHLDNLDQVGLGVDAHALHAMLFEGLGVAVVELIAVAVAFFEGKAKSEK